MKKTLKRIEFLALLVFLAIGLVGCGGGNKDSDGDGNTTVKISVTSVPHAEIFEHIQPELEKDGIKVDLTVADDYDVHNRSLAENEVDANFFQHLPYLEEQIGDFSYEIQEFGKIHIEPLGVYSKKFASLDDLPEGATISIPNDPTNEARALALLHRNGLIEMEDLDNLKATIINIKENPKNFKFQEVDAAMLSRTLEDVDASVINTNFALAADLDPTGDALVLEDADSPYVNILTIKNGDENREELIAIKKALMSDSVRKFIEDKYEGAIVPVF